MSYDPSPIPQPTPPFYTTPPAPPPKPTTSVDARGPPLPPPPPHQNEPSELDAGQAYQHQQYAPQSPLQQQPQQINIPPVEAGWLPEGLRDKSTTDLHDLLNDPALQSALLSNPNTTHPAVPATHAHLQPLLETNTALSTHLVTLERTLATKRQQSQSRLLALKALEQQHRAKIEETERALQQWSPMALYQSLSASVGEQESLVRGLEESWLEEDGVASAVEVEAFVRRVREVRKLSFLRRERKARWDEGRVGGWR